jgi:HK97 gp10 family phage protein
VASDLNNLEVDLLEGGLRVAARAVVVVRKNGADVVRDAQAFCPVDTGNLKNSIGVDYDREGLGYEAGSSVSYAPFIEYGTSRMGPHAFLGPAFDRNLPTVIAALDSLGGSIVT